MHPKCTASPDAEEWRPYPEFPALYEVSSFGRVRRSAGTKAARPGQISPAQILKPHIGKKTGYGHVVLSVGASRVLTRLVHLMVAAAFLGPCPPGQEVNHKDGRRWNAAASNLEYLTHPANMADAHQRRGAPQPQASLTMEQAAWVRTQFAAGRGATALARALNVPRGVVRAILEGRTYKYGAH